jgi:hypothetical protein
MYLNMSRAGKEGVGVTRRQLLIQGSAALGLSLGLRLLFGFDRRVFAQPELVLRDPIAQATPVNPDDYIDVYFPEEQKWLKAYPKTTGGGNVGIFGVNYRDYHYITSSDNQQVPMWQLRVIDGNPFSQLLRHPSLGIRNDLPSLMDKVPQVGASKVRIAANGPNITFGIDSEVDRAIQSALKENLDPLIVWNPGLLLPDEVIERTIRSLLLNYPAVHKIQIGNEMDNREYEYWKNGDLSTYTHFFSVARQEMLRLNPSADVLTGALIFPHHYRELVSLLAGKGINPRDIIFGVHAYNTTADVETKINDIKNYISFDSKIVVTELGVSSFDTFVKSTHIISMLDKAFEMGAMEVYLHELSAIEGTGFGMLADNNSLEPAAYMTQVWAQNNMPRKTLLNRNRFNNIFE